MDNFLNRLNRNPYQPIDSASITRVDELGNGYDDWNNLIAPKFEQPQQTWGETALGVATAPARMATALAGSLSPYGADGWQIPPIVHEGVNALTAVGDAYNYGMTDDEINSRALGMAGFMMGGGGLAARPASRAANLFPDQPRAMSADLFAEAVPAGERFGAKTAAAADPRKSKHWPSWGDREPDRAAAHVREQEAADAWFSIVDPIMYDERGLKRMERHEAEALAIERFPDALDKGFAYKEAAKAWNEIDKGRPMTAAEQAWFDLDLAPGRARTSRDEIMRDIVMPNMIMPDGSTGVQHMAAANGPKKLYSNASKESSIPAIASALEQKGARPEPSANALSSELSGTGFYPLSGGAETGTYLAFDDIPGNAPSPKQQQVRQMAAGHQGRMRSHPGQQAPEGLSSKMGGQELDSSGTPIGSFLDRSHYPRTGLNPIHEVHNWAKVRSMARKAINGEHVPGYLYDGLNGNGNLIAGTHRAAANELLDILGYGKRIKSANINDVLDEPEAYGLSARNADRLRQAAEDGDYRLIDEIWDQSRDTSLFSNSDSRPALLASALDMSTEARLARMGESGFEPGWLHGSWDTGISEIDPSKFGSRFGRESDSGGFITTTNPEVANYYAQFRHGRGFDESLPFRGDDVQGAVYPLATRAENPLLADASFIAEKFPQWADDAKYSGDGGQVFLWDLAGKDLADFARANGNDAVILNAADGKLQLSINPRNIRSVNAAFDPAKADSANILAANSDSRPALLAGALDMSPEARLARAREMGFDTDKTWYHGSPQGDLETITPGYDEPGAWFTTDKMNAANYARGDAPGLYDVLLKSKKPLRVNFEYNDYGEPFPIVDGAPLELSDNVSIVKYAQRNGYDSVHFPDGNFSESGNTMVVFDPRNIRSVNAAFDPAKSDSANLLAANADSRPALLASALGQEQRGRFGTALPDGVSLERSPNGENYQLYAGKDMIGSSYVRDLGDNIQLGNVWLDPNWQRQGIGNALHGIAEQDFGKQAVPDVSLSDAALSFWRKYDPEAVSSYEKTPWGQWSPVR